MTTAAPLRNAISGKPAGADGYVRLEVDRAGWIDLAIGAAQGHHDLSALWHDAGRMRMALMAPAEGLRAIVSLTTAAGAYPSVGRHHAPAIRLERAMRDLYATTPEDLPDGRPWLDHGRWPPPSPSADGAAGPPPAAAPAPYLFLPVEGEGLHQIPVGPVHAGIIEPGHFRFTASGETVVRLEQRLGYVHKGVEALCAGADLATAGRIAGRISGDSTVAYALAFAQAVEAALGVAPPARAVLLRGVMAELERIANHVGDVGAICNDASVAALHARCMLIREDILQTAGKAFGHRLMMDRIVPGGVAIDPDAEAIAALRGLMRRIETDFAVVVAAYDDLPSLQDRTATTGIVAAGLARRFAAGGHVGRASGRVFDVRAAFPRPPYDEIAIVPVIRTAGDVDARVWVRIGEVAASVEAIRRMLDRLAPGPVATPWPPARAGEGAALVEAFRGDLFLTVRIDEAGRVAHLHARDASWFQWPLLEAAIEGNIVADFPLCNKSFNCSYSGHDL